MVLRAVKQMTLRTRALLSEIAISLAGTGCLFGFVALGNHLYLLVLGVLGFVLHIPGTIWVRSLFRCPVCGTSVFERAGIFVTYWPAPTCAKCQSDLRNR